MTAPRQLTGVGASELADSREAGYAAASAAAASLAGAPATLVIVFTSVRYDLGELLDGVRAVTGTAPLVGASSSGHFHDGVLVEPGEGVVVLVLGPGPYRFGVASATGLREDAFAAGREMTRAARAAAGPERLAHAAIILLSDGLAGHQQTLLSGVHRVAGASVPVAGGAAGDDRRLERTFVFHDGEVLTDAAVAVWIDSPHRLDVVVAHGWRPVSLPLLVTRVDGTVLHEIGGRPALDAFREHFPHGEEVERALRYAPVDGWPRSHALGLIEPDGTQLVRGAYLDEEGQVHTFAPLPPYSAVQIMACEPDDLLEVADGIASGAVSGREPGVLLVFSCVARFDILRDRGAEEARRLQAAAASVPTFGFFTYGEFARTTSVAGYHNATVAAIAL
ncbi:FIST signal transduction protein [Phytohabitans houttuyneae]|uniref:Histidine kinase n=1 Tax=Phytohabitans houttuyneae TaxID=1076126 RepID=A0A6V8K2H9_9ACTN|nr:FIST N-terminal domain-containing protein [Phytohabitans houttuyneae]GFJ77914.1 histidine kinase [Phytohabitans houttuyneae]